MVQEKNGKKIIVLENVKNRAGNQELLRKGERPKEYPNRPNI